jgi:hypothetical protein
MSANRPVGLINRDLVHIDPIHYRESCFRSVRFADRGGVSSSRAERWRYPEQLFVKQSDRSPLGPAAACPLSVYRLNRGLELKAAGATVTRRFGEMTFRFFD